MVLNNFKLAFRNMWHNKALALLQISGLSIGVAASLLLAIYINGQWKFDRFHQKVKRL
ncbi:MAG: hypothetical protein IPL23_25700 [Saprospiraceae bacterium]|nr:hypothetical protein [Saprospiraceae bacterium]